MKVLKSFGSQFKKRIVDFILSMPSTKSREAILIGFYCIVYMPNMLKKFFIFFDVLQSIKKNNFILYKNSKRALFNYYLRENNVTRFTEYLKNYQNQSVIAIRRNISQNISNNTPIFICVVKNDLQRVKMQIDHHKNLGLKNFVYIDNMSDDGTFEWLLKENVDIYRVNEKFSATAKNAWIRQITDTYGYDRWYLILDSDELFVYPGVEHSKINNLIEFANSEKICLFQSFMIDMYSKDSINEKFSKSISPDNYDIKAENCYFDIDSYFISRDYKGDKILGGPRHRVFSEENKKFTPLLTKNSLMFLKKEDIFGIHFSMPFFKNFNNHIVTGLLHYKFLPEDNNKYLEIIEQGNYAGGSAEYKQYIKMLRKNEKITFYYDYSEKFNTSLDLLKINIFDKNYSERLNEYLLTQK